MQPIVTPITLVNGEILKNGASIISGIDEVRQYSYIVEVFRNKRALLTISTADIAMGKYEIIDSTGFSKQLSLSQFNSKIVSI